MEKTGTEIMMKMAEDARTHRLAIEYEKAKMDAYLYGAGYLKLDFYGNLTYVSRSEIMDMKEGE